MTPRIMLQLMQIVLALVRSLFANKADLAMENLALRQQLAVYKRKQPRPRLSDLDRLFWTALKDQFAGWADALVIVKPETVIRWQKKRFRKHWARKSKPGRPTIDRQHIAFIKRISGGAYFAPPCGRSFEGQAIPSMARTASPLNWR